MASSVQHADRVIWQNDPDDNPAAHAAVIGQILAAVLGSPDYTRTNVTRHDKESSTEYLKQIKKDSEQAGE